MDRISRAYPLLDSLDSKDGVCSPQFKCAIGVDAPSDIRMHGVEELVVPMSYHMLGRDFLGLNTPVLMLQWKGDLKNKGAVSGIDIVFAKGIPLVNKNKVVAHWEHIRQRYRIVC